MKMFAAECALIALSIVAVVALVLTIGHVAPQPSQSWDQENLKRNDHGCPTAVYVAPNGDLHQCP